MSAPTSRREFLAQCSGLALVSAHQRQPPVPNHRRAALVIGVHEYSLNSGFVSLPGADYDAGQMHSDLSAAGYDAVLMKSPSRPDRVPTCSNIESQIDCLASRSDLRTLLIYYAGHAVVSSEGGKPLAYLMPFGARSDDAQKTGVSLAKIATSLARGEIAGRILHVILILDTCRIGAVGVAPDIVRALANTPGRWLFVTSCSNGQSSVELPPDERTVVWQAPETLKPHGLFTREIAMAAYQPHLGGDGKGGASPFTIDEIMRYAVPSTAKKASAMGRQQTPEVFGFLNSANEPFILPKSRPRTENRIRAEQVLQPKISPTTGRFYAYRSGAPFQPMPFRPYAWMYGDTEPITQIDPEIATELMQLDIASKTMPMEPTGTCVHWRATWKAHRRKETVETLWDAVGWVSAPDAPMWWAEDRDNRATYYNLQSAEDTSQQGPRRFSGFAFFARSPRAGTVIHATVGFLSRDQKHNRLVLGDSLEWPIEAQFALDTKWPDERKPFTIPFPDDADLSRICSFSFAVRRSDQQLQKGEKPADFFDSFDLFKRPVDLYIGDVFFF